jgi:hypothetical protein
LIHRGDCSISTFCTVSSKFFSLLAASLTRHPSLNRYPRLRIKHEHCYGMWRAMAWYTFSKVIVLIEVNFCPEEWRSNYLRNFTYLPDYVPSDPISSEWTRISFWWSSVQWRVW